MTPELSQQIAKWQADCQHIDDLIKSCPALDDLNVMKSWEDTMHEWLTYIGNQTPIAEAEYARACARVIESGDIHPDAFKLIKNHSGQIDRYMIAKNPELFTIWQQLKNLGKTMSDILWGTRTNMVSQRELDKRDSFQRTSQIPQGRRMTIEDYTLPNTVNTETFIGLDNLFPDVER